MPTLAKIAILLVAAVVLAVVARMFYVAQNAPAPVAESEIKVRVAATDLPAGLLLRDDDLAWTTLRLSAVPKDAVTERSRTTLEGSLLRRATPAGSPITTADILSPDAPGFLAAALPPDMRAVSIPVNEVSGNAGLIRPGDHVDLILTQDLRGRTTSRSGGSVVSETIVQNARVIAVGGRIQGSDGTADSRVRTVTIQVAPRAAEVIAVASRLGTLSLALRSFAIADRTRATPSGATVSAWSDQAPTPVWGTDVSQALEAASSEAEAAAAPVTAPTQAPPAPQNRTVTILRGSVGQTTNLAAPAAGTAASGITGTLQGSVRNLTQNLSQTLGVSIPVPD